MRHLGAVRSNGGFRDVLTNIGDLQKQITGFNELRDPADPFSPSFVNELRDGKANILFA